jgi:ribosome-associated protein
MIELPDDEDDAERGPSKSQRKRDMHELQALGQRLSELSVERLAQIELPESLAEAIAEFRRLRAHEARRRQLQLIGKLMRPLDAPAVREAIDRVTGDSQAAVAAMHRAERLRERLLEDDAALTDFVAEFPAADAQQLRHLIRAARREREAARAPRSARELYRLLHALVLPPMQTLYLPDDDES